jgi:hypothetical protein
MDLRWFCCEFPYESPYDEPSILYYHLCEPNMEVNQEDDPGFLQPVTAIARVLCLCLMSFDSRIRNQK